MTIARVVHVSGLRDNPPPEAIKVIEALRATDGCEGMYTLRNSQTGEGLGINLWRDQDALDAAADQIKAANEVATKNGLSISSIATYDIVTER
jgi:hypothetical protein